jgi:hypothetical protein
MATKYALKFTRTRPSADVPWLQADPEDSSRLTEEEYTTIAVPYWNMVRSQNNFTSLEITNPDELTKVTTILFENYESAADAMLNIRRNDVQDANAVAMAALALNKNEVPISTIFEFVSVTTPDIEP